MSAILNLVISRAKEPSSMASVAVLLGALGWQVSDETLGVVMGVIGGVAALAGIFMKEKGAE